MSNSFLALSIYIGWMLVLLICLEVLRAVLVLKKEHLANSFSTNGDDLKPFGKRLTRAQANCYESFPFVGGLLLLALATDNTGITDPLAIYVLIARLAQSVVHLASGSILATQLRFVFFCVQVIICSWWVINFIFLS